MWFTEGFKKNSLVIGIVGFIKCTVSFFIYIDSRINNVIYSSLYLEVLRLN